MLQLAPLAYGTESWVAGSVNHDAFWRLPESERQRRREEGARLTSAYRRPPSLPPAAQQQYEAQQPPLYYALLVAPYLAVKDRPLTQQVLWLRLLSLAMASLTIPLAYAVARQIPAARRTAVQVAALVACMPRWPSICRGSAITRWRSRSISAALLCTLRALRRGHMRDWALLGIVLAAALLAKGYALVMVPVVLLPAGRCRRALAGGALALALAASGARAGGTPGIANHRHPCR